MVRAQLLKSAMTYTEWLKQTKPSLTLQDSIMNRVLLTIITTGFTLFLSGCGNNADTLINDTKKSNLDITNQEAQTNASFEIKKNTKNSETDKENTTSGATEITAPDSWRAYTKEDMNITLKYHKDWYYDRDESREKELGYQLLIGFAPGSEYFEQKGPYPIELHILSAEKNNAAQLDENNIIIEKNGKNYLLQTTDTDKYGDIVNTMKASFKFITNN